MRTGVVTRIGRYGNPRVGPRCPDCGAPLVATYRESEEVRLHGLELVLACVGDCGYARKPRRQPSKIAV